VLGEYDTCLKRVFTPLPLAGEGKTPQAARVRASQAGHALALTLVRCANLSLSRKR